MVWLKVDRIERFEWSDRLELTIIHSAIIQPVICNQSLIDQTAQSNQSNGDFEFSRYCKVKARKVYSFSISGHFDPIFDMLWFVLLCRSSYDCVSYNLDNPQFFRKLDLLPLYKKTLNTPYYFKSDSSTCTTVQWQHAGLVRILRGAIILLFVLFFFLFAE